MRPPEIGPEQRRQQERYRRVREARLPKLRPVRATWLLVPQVNPAFTAFLAAVTAEAFDGRFVPSAPPLRPFRDVVVAMCADAGVGHADLVGQRRDRRITGLRHELYWLGAVEHGLSLPQVGRRLQRDHTSVLHGLRRVNAVFAAAFGLSGAAALQVTAVARHEAVQRAYRTAADARDERGRRSHKGARP